LLPVTCHMLQNISLANFRNFTKKEFSFSEQVTVIVGDNAVGKTNILESIFLLATGKSFKAKVEDEMVGYGKDVARIVGIVGSNQSLAFQARKYDAGTEELPPTSYNIHPTNLEVVLTDGEIRIGDAIQKAPRKKLLVNGVPRRLVDFAGHFTVVLFAPNDLELVTESPSIRRKFLDTVLSQTDREYRRSLLSYEKGVRQRNKILYNIRENGASRSQLLFWNHLLIKNGDYIARKREEFINFVNEQKPLSSNTYLIEYDKSAISESRLEQYKREEVASATTLVGPHRDDFITKIKNAKDKPSLPLRGKNQMLDGERELGTYGSRGEQRMGVLWLKLAELAYIQQITQTPPTLLLDDIFSELDHLHRDVVMDVIRNNQTIITTPDPHYIEDIEGANIIEL
jgi:DNA replication and repair protein RecF